MLQFTFFCLTRGEIARVKDRLHSYFGDFNVLSENDFGILSFGAVRYFYIVFGSNLVTAQCYHFLSKLTKKLLETEAPEIWWLDGVNFLASTRKRKGIPLWLSLREHQEAGVRFLL